MVVRAQPSANVAGGLFSTTASSAPMFPAGETRSALYFVPVSRPCRKPPRQVCVANQPDRSGASPDARSHVEPSPCGGKRGLGSPV